MLVLVDVGLPVELEDHGEEASEVRGVDVKQLEAFRGRDSDRLQRVLCGVNANQMCWKNVKYVKLSS